MRPVAEIFEFLIELRKDFALLLLVLNLVFVILIAAAVVEQRLAVFNLEVKLHVLVCCLCARLGSVAMGQYVAVCCRVL